MGLARAQALGVELVDVTSLLRAADIVTLHVPVVDWTQHLINADTLRTMKKGAFLINAARGGLCDEAAVAEAVQSGQLGGQTSVLGLTRGDDRGVDVAGGFTERGADSSGTLGRVG